MALFYFSIGAADNMSTLKKRLDSIREEGANISYTIVSVSNVTLKINEIELSIQYELSQASNAQYYWYLCDAYNQESLVILCDSPIVNENGKDNTLGIGTYNRAYFRCKKQMIEIPFTEDTFATRFNLIKGKFNTFEDENENDDSVMLTKCTFNDDTVVSNGEIIIADNLYVSSNLRDINFKTIVKDAEGNTFINVGGIFYMDNVDYVTANSTCPILIVVPDGRIKYEWNANTKKMPGQWWSSNEEIYAKANFSNQSFIQEGEIFLSNNIVIPYNYKESNGVTFYSIHRGLNKGSDGLPIYIDICNLDNSSESWPLNYKSSYGGSYGRFINWQSDSSLNIEYAFCIKGDFDSNSSTLSYKVPYQDPFFLDSYGSISEYKLYVAKFSKATNITKEDDNKILFSLFINSKKVYEDYLRVGNRYTNMGISNIRFGSASVDGHSYDGISLKYVGIEPVASSDEEILDNMQYLRTKFKIS